MSLPHFDPDAAAQPGTGIFGLPFGREQARLVLSPRLAPRTAWLEYETELRSPALRALFAALVSLTPGTLTCDLARRTLSVHVLDTGDLEATRERIRRRLERPLLGMEGR